MTHPIDIHVGRRLRALRKEKGITQERLAQALGVSFQQLQKYEKAQNRIAASRLYDLARILKVCILDFYPSLNDEAKKSSPVSKAAFFKI